MALAIALALAVLASLTTAEWRLALTRGRVAASRALASESSAQLPTDPQLALLLALRAYDTAGTVQAEAAVRGAVQAASLQAILPATPRAQFVGDGAFDRSGRWVVAYDRKGTVEVWDWQGDETPGGQSVRPEAQGDGVGRTVRPQ